MRAWRGPALLSYGFRPFFLFAGIWAVLAMAAWLAILGGWIDLPTHFDPVSWHAHEMLFGYLSAVVAGFLLTAVPNWTGRLPIVGWPLGGLIGLWVMGRMAIAFSTYLPVLLVAAVDLVFLIVLALAIAREILSGRNWRNLPVLAMLTVLIVANGLYHWEANSSYAASGYGLRLGLAGALMLISLIGGRIVPSFTRNWLVKQENPSRPASFDLFDKMTLAFTAIALVVWISWPATVPTAIFLIVAGAFQTLRLSRWSGSATGAEPLVWVLHAGYAFIPLGSVLLGIAILISDPLFMPAAQHVWMAGGIGLMTLAVMTRATLGHTGQELRADPGTSLTYLALIGSVAARLAAGLMPNLLDYLYNLSGLLWLIAFGGFILLYGPALLRARRPA